MGLRVGLIVVGIVIGVVLREYGWSMRASGIVAFLPFVLAEVLGYTSGPYEKTAHDVMHESAAPDSKDPPRNG